MNFRKQAQKYGAKVKSVAREVVLSAGALGASAAMAADGIDTSGATTAIAAAGVAVGVIGLAVFTLKVGQRTWKWLTGAL